MKVDEQFKCKDCDNYNQCKYYHNRRETSFICKEFQNQWGFIEKLEKLKAELHETAEMHSNGNYYLRDEWIDEYIDNHIAELKGENNAEKSEM